SNTMVGAAGSGYASGAALRGRRWARRDRRSSDPGVAMSRHASLQRAKAPTKGSEALSDPVAAPGRLPTAKRLLGPQGAAGNRAFDRLPGLARAAAVSPPEQDWLPPIVPELLHPIIQEPARSLIEPRQGTSARTADFAAGGISARLRVSEPTDAS